MRACEASATTYSASGGSSERTSACTSSSDVNAAGSTSRSSNSTQQRRHPERGADAERDHNHGSAPRRFVVAAAEGLPHARRARDGSAHGQLEAHRIHRLWWTDGGHDRRARHTHDMHNMCMCIRMCMCMCTAVFTHPYSALQVSRAEHVFQMMYLGGPGGARNPLQKSSSPLSPGSW